MPKALHLQTVQPPPLHFGIIRNRAKTKLVGVVAPSYGSEKLSYALNVPGYSYRKVMRIPFHRLEKNGSFWRYSAFVLDNSVHLMHTNNHIPFSFHPFVLSFENELPRYLGKVKKWMLQMGINRLLSPKCKRILGISSIAVELAKESFSSMGYDELASKIDLFRGGVDFCTDSIKLPNVKQTDPLRLLFVGRAGFSKGLIPTVEAVETARNGGLNVELSIISKLVGGEYVLKEFMPDAQEWEKRILSKSYIRLQKSSTNREVRAAMRTHDLLVFPTLDETLGWVVIEAGLERLPAVATNVFALPELIDNETTGSIIDLDLGRQRRWKGIFLDGSRLSDAIEKAYSTIHHHIVSLLHRASLDRSILRKWGEGARTKLEAMYNPVKAGRALAEIYDCALDNSRFRNC